MIKYFVILTLLLNITGQAMASEGAKLIDFILSGSGIVEVLGKYGIKGNDAKMVESYVGSALIALGSKKSVTKQELMDILSRLPIAGSDASVRKELQILLDKSEGELRKEDVVKAINNIIYLANRHGKSVIITCAECVNESLAKNGFKFTVENIKNSSSLKVLNEVLPKNPAELNTFISSRMRRLGMGDYSKVTPDVVSPAEEKSLALFLGLAESGSPDQKALIAAIKKLSTRNGKTNIIDPKNPQKFWKVVADDMSPQYMSSWTKTLNEVSARAEKDNVGTEEAFYRTLKAKAEGNDHLMKQYETLKAKRCFFK
jgi:predicted Zn-ribbon and HTH transcriptional regulator